MADESTSNMRRYTQRHFPPYRYLPFQGASTNPHPRNDPNGHSYNEEETYLPDFYPDDWRNCESYLYGVDLFNFGYWWEAHESWEAVWLAAGQKKTACGRFIQGLIQLSGAQLKRHTGEVSGARSLTNAGCAKLLELGGIYLGIEVEKLVKDARFCLEEDETKFPIINLLL